MELKKEVGALVIVDEQQANSVDQREGAYVVENGPT